MNPNRSVFKAVIVACALLLALGAVSSAAQNKKDKAVSACGKSDQDNPLCLTPCLHDQHPAHAAKRPIVGPVGLTVFTPHFPTVIAKSTLSTKAIAA